MKKDTDYVIVRGEVGDIESIVQFQADMAMESEGCVLDKERVTRALEGWRVVEKHKRQALWRQRVYRQGSVRKPFHRWRTVDNQSEEQ